MEYGGSGSNQIKEGDSYRSLPRCRDNVPYKNYNVVKEQRGRQKGCPINISLMINFIASWGRKREKRISINLLRQGK